MPSRSCAADVTGDKEQDITVPIGDSKPSGTGTAGFQGDEGMQSALASVPAERKGNAVDHSASHSTMDPLVPLLSSGIAEIVWDVGTMSSEDLAEMLRSNQDKLQELAVPGLFSNLVSLLATGTASEQEEAARVSCPRSLFQPSVIASYWYCERAGGGCKS
eukprot:gene22398-29510_t